MGMDKDLPPGEKLVACFRPFLEELAASDLSTKTIQKHVDNLWALGGEIIRDLHEDPSLEGKASSRFSPTESTTKVDRWSTPWNRRRTNSVPSIPLAGNSTASSVNRPAESRQIHPQIPPTRRSIKARRQAARCGGLLCRMPDALFDRL
jgi:hypothetical protein